MYAVYQGNWDTVELMLGQTLVQGANSSALLVTIHKLRNRVLVILLALLLYNLYFFNLKKRLNIFITLVHVYCIIYIYYISKPSDISERTKI